MRLWNLRSGRVGLLAGTAALVLFLGTLGTAAPRSKAYLAQHRSLVRALRLYLDPSRDHSKTWTGVDAAVGELVSQDDAVLSDPERLRWLTDQSRSFAPPFTDREWRRNEEVIASERHGVLRRIVSENLRLTWLQPRDYNPKQAWRRYPREEPRPWLITLHDTEDLRGRAPAGVAVLKRRWPYATAPDLYKEWFVLAPEAPKAAFVGPEGALHVSRSVIPMLEFWSRYHVDFDRVILEGSAQVLDLAAAFPYWLAGLVIREGRLGTRRKALVRNYANLPIFVVDNKRLAAELRLAGHTQVTVGSSSQVLPWMTGRHRTLPSTYRWNATHPLHARSHWVQVEERIGSAAFASLDVASVDTKADPNTVRIKASGIRSLSVHLDDRILDLDRPIRIVINGTLTRTVRVADPKQGRSFKQIWTDKPFQVRKSRRYGRLFPAQVAHIEVPTAR